MPTEQVDISILQSMRSLLLAFAFDYIRSMFWNYPVPVGAVISAIVVGVLLLIPVVRQKLLSVRFIGIFAAIPFVVGMILLPSKNHLMGDGLTLLGLTDRFFAPTEPLTQLLYFGLSKLLGSQDLAYRLVTVVAGLFFLFGLSLFARFGQNALEKAVIVSSFVCTATLQFYFGYVEHYLLLHLFLLYYLYFAWRDLMSNRSTLWPFFLFLLSLVSHFSSIVLLPSLLYLYCRRYRRLIRYFSVILLFAGLVAAWKADINTIILWKVDITTVVVPFKANDFSWYSLLSREHLLDLANLLLLITPAYFLVFLGKPKGQVGTFLLTAVIGTLLFTILVDPKIGAFRDWDLLSIYAYPLAALIALTVPKRPAVLVLLVVLITVRIVPWLIFNSSLQVDYVKERLKNDLHYSQHYDKGFRFVSWGRILYAVGDFKGAEEVWLKRLQYVPDHQKTLEMLAPLEFQMGKYADAQNYFLKLLALNNHPEFRYKASYSALRAGDYRTALDLIAQGSENFRLDSRTVLLYSGILAALGKHQAAMDYLLQLPRDFSEGYLPYVLARSALDVGRLDVAQALLAEAVKLDSMKTEYRALRDSLSGP